MHRLILTFFAFATLTAGGATLVLGEENGTPTTDGAQAMRTFRSNGLGGGLGTGGLLHGGSFVVARGAGPGGGGTQAGSATASGGGNMGGTGTGNMMGNGCGNMMGTGNMRGSTNIGVCSGPNAQ